ncbi:MAG TPA: hypothetical protein VF105_09900 [Gemmatimonadaceae bacterium]
MPRLAFGVARLSIPALLGVQIACGGDSSGPKHVATSIEANSSTTITAAAGSAARERPSVIVRDENGDPMAGATVVFTVTSGDGSLTGSTLTTNSNGGATVGSWILGQTAVTNTVDATTSGLPAVRFTANAGDPCAVTSAHALGSTSNGSLTLADCQSALDGSFVDFWAVTIPSAGTYLINQASTAIDSYLYLLSASHQYIAENNNGGPTTTNATIKAILPAGDFVMVANSFSAGETGSYGLSTAVTSNNITNCEDVFTIRGITTEQSLQTTDCNQGGLMSDDYIIGINLNESITVTMTSSTIDPYLELYQIGSRSLSLVAANDDADATTKNASLTYTARGAGYFLLKATTTSVGTTGTYTLNIQ